MKADFLGTGPAGYAIKKAESGHIPLLNDIERAAATLFPEGYLPEHILSDALPGDMLEAAMDEERLFVAVDRDDSPVGYILLEIIDDLALVAQIDVHPDHGKQGLGTALILHGMRQIRKRGNRELYLTTFSDIRWNASFYKKLGFDILEKGDIPEAIARILKAEKRRGLKNRVAMRFKYTKQTSRACLDYYKQCLAKRIKMDPAESIET